MKLRCTHCRKAFSWDPQLPWPDNCPFLDCQEDISMPDRGEGVVMPFIRSAKTSNNDKLYRDMEGASVADMSSLKITDMNDQMRAGDMAAKAEADAAMARLKATTKAPIGFAENGAEFSAGLSSGAISVNGPT